MKTKVILTLALLLGLAATAQAANPNPFPDQWSCGNAISAPAYCLRISNLGNNGTGSALELLGTSGRILYVHSGGSPGLFITEPGGDINTIALRGFNQGNGVGGTFSALFNDGGVGTTASSTRSGIVGRNTSGAGSPGIWTDSQVWGAGWNQVSDQRTKRDFAANPYGLQQILALKTYSYVLKADQSNTVRIGFKADDVERAMPLAVHVGPDGVDADGKKVPGMEKLKGIDLTAIIAGLVETVQAQQKEIDAIKAAVTP